MQRSRIIAALQEIRAYWVEQDGGPPDPIDHPSLAAMSLRDLADLPFDPPLAPRPDGHRRAIPRPAAAAVTRLSGCLAVPAGHGR